MLGCRLRAVHGIRAHAEPVVHEPPSVDRYRHIAERCAELLSKRSDHTVSSVAASGAVTAALCFDAAGNRSRARHYAALATSLSPDSGPARLVRGLVYHRAASPKAGEHLRLAAERLPHLVWPRLYLAHLAVIEERYDDCIRWADEGLSRDASDAEPLPIVDDRHPLARVEPQGLIQEQGPAAWGRASTTTTNGRSPS